jgi:hypothetical protein
VPVVASHLTRSNQEWALDFDCDALGTGGGILVLAVFEAYTRECLTSEVDISLSLPITPRRRRKTICRTRRLSAGEPRSHP